MIRKSAYIVCFTISAGMVQAQAGVNLPVITNTIVLKENPTTSNSFMVYRDSIFQVMASENAISHHLAVLGPEDFMQRAFRDVKATKSTDFYSAVQQDLGLMVLLGDLLEEGSCSVIKRKDHKRVEAVLSKTYSENGTKGIRYYADGRLLLDYIDLVDR